MTVGKTVAYLDIKEPVGTAIKQDGVALPKLFTPLRIKETDFQNRIGVAPMCQYSAEDGVAGEFLQIHYKSILLRGPGLTITEAAAVSPEGRISPDDLGIWNDEQAQALANIVSYAHSQKQKIGIQLAHAGRKASTSPPALGLNKSVDAAHGGWPDQTFAASGLAFNEGLPKPHELTKEQISKVVDDFAQAAKRAVEVAKFDVLEIHAAHGYLVNTFLSSYSNRRTDEYGGSFENRIRFLLEIIAAIKKVVPESTPLWVRISAVENVENEPLSWTIEDSVKLSEIVVEKGIDVIDVSSGGNNPNQIQRGISRGMHVPHSAAIKNAIGDKGLVAVVGALDNAEYANGVLNEGKADIILIGRGFLKNPALVYTLAKELDVKVKSPPQYSRAY